MQGTAENRPHGAPLPCRGGAGVGSVISFLRFFEVCHIRLPTSESDKKLFV